MKEFSIKFDKLEPRRKKVAIVGFASSTRLKAPYADPAWEIWGENQLYRFIPRATRWFEIHPHPPSPRSWLVDQVPGTDYLKWMREAPIPIYMVSQHPDIPNSISYPIEQMVDEFGLEGVRPDMRGKGYFHSSVDFMLALAISEGFEEIGVWGIDMVHDTEYGYQKPSGSFWLGMARGRGIKVTIPAESALLNNEGYRYGYDAQPSHPLMPIVEQRKQQIAKRRDELLAELRHLDGMTAADTYWAEQFKHMARGSTPTME